MTTTQTTSRAKLPTVYAVDMLIAQGWKPSAEEMIAIKARADFFESEDMSREVHIGVRDPYTNARIGSLIFSA